MCLIFLAVDHHPDYKLIVAANRDEFYNRETARADYWIDFPHVLGGRDLEAMGTWLGMTQLGKIAMLTNYRDLSTLKTGTPSRGELVSDYLINEVEAAEYIKLVEARGSLYNGFNLLAGTINELWYYSNFGNGVQRLDHGVYGLSNHLLDTPWPKVVKGKRAFQEFLNDPKPDKEMLFQLLANEEVSDDAGLPSTGLPMERERALSAMFIKTPDYGSRCSTVIMVDRKNNVTFSERVYDFRTSRYATETFTFSAAV